MKHRSRARLLLVLALAAPCALADAAPASGQALAVAAARDGAAGTEAAGTAAEAATAAAVGAATYPVAARDLRRGEVLTPADIAQVPIGEGEGVVEDAPITLVGWTTRRVIAEGEPLRRPAVSPPDLVKAGEPVQAVYQGKTIVLRVSGTAAGSGAMGDRVLVRVDARRRLEGVVIGPALVQLESNESR
jgi:flagella basal body P-ring formation protein FlgA